MTRAVTLAPLFLASLLALPAVSSAGNPGQIIEQEYYEIEVTLDIERTDLVVTRRFFNPSLYPLQLELPLDLDCEVTVSDLRIVDGAGAWVEAPVLPTADVETFWSGHLYAAPSADPAVDADTVVTLARGYCDADLELYPIPPLGTRTISYRLSYTPDYDRGVYRVELPAFPHVDGPAAIRFSPDLPAGFSVAVDDLDLSPSLELSGRQGHSLSFSARDRALPRLHRAELELASMGVPESARRIAAARFDLPQSLAELPPVRRVMVVVDASFSLPAKERERLLEAAATYLGVLAELQPEVRVEVLTFDRELRQVYGDFVPARWVAEDLPHLDIELHNGSEVGVALDEARALLTAARDSEGDQDSEGTQGTASVDWVLLLSDFDLCTNFDLDVERAKAPGVHMHLARAANEGDFRPELRTAPWAEIAGASGGAAWVLGSSAEAFEVAWEWFEPRQIWNLELHREGPDGRTVQVPLHGRAPRGTRVTWLDIDALGPSDAPIEFVGEVWGQRRRWSAPADSGYGLALAGAFAVEDDTGELSDPERQGLGLYAQIISPFTTAVGVAVFSGSGRPLEANSWGMRGFGAGGWSTHCGGGRYGRRRALTESSKVDNESLLRELVASCEDSPPGRFQFEVIEQEIVAVDSLDPCIERALWGLDMRAGTGRSRGLFVVEHEGGRQSAEDLRLVVVDAEHRETLAAQLY